MVGQSFAIIAVILVMSFMFLRAGRRGGALLTVPLVCVPLFHLAGTAVHRIPVSKDYATITLLCTIDIIGLAVGIAFCAIVSKGIVMKKMRLVYFVSCTIFLVALTAAYILFLLR